MQNDALNVTLFHVSPGSHRLTIHGENFLLPVGNVTLKQVTEYLNNQAGAFIKFYVANENTIGWSKLDERNGKVEVQKGTYDLADHN